MADVLDTTFSGETSNSYCTLDYADDYFENHFSTAKSTMWATYTDNQKIQLLIQACFTIEQLRFTVVGAYSSPRLAELGWNNITGKFMGYVNPSAESCKYYFYQALQFPRNKDMYTSGVPYIPDRVMKAQCEQAIYLTSFDDTSISNAMQGVSLDTISVDKIKLTQEYSGSQGSTIAPLAIDYLKPYLIYHKRLKRS